MAEEYKDNKPAKTVVTREGAENGAREYPIPQKKAFPWWWLLPLLLIPLLFLISRNRGDKQADSAPAASAASPVPVAMASATDSPAAGESPAPDASPAAGAAAPPPGPSALNGKNIKVFKGSDITVSPKAGASAKGEPLTDVFAITGAKDRSVLVGRKVQLKNVSVTRVLNDQAFYVGTNADAQMLVLLDPKLDAGTAGGEKVVIAEGKTVSLTGLLEKAPTAAQLNTYKVGADEATAIGQQGVYLHATIAQDKGDKGSDAAAKG